MPIRFSTEAANADFMGEDPQPAGTPEGLPQAAETGGTSRDRRDRTNDRTSSRNGEAKPGKDINAAGFVKDKDADKP